MTVAIPVGFVVAAVIGTLLRWGAARRANEYVTMPYNTMAVNVVGSFGLGLLASASAPVLTIVGVGGFGALTTFSTFTAEVVDYLRESDGRSAAIYVAMSVAFSIAAAWIGLVLSPF